MVGRPSWQTPSPLGESRGLDPRTPRARGCAYLRRQTPPSPPSLMGRRSQGHVMSDPCRCRKCHAICPAPGHTAAPAPPARRAWSPGHFTWLLSPSHGRPGMALPLQVWVGLSRGLPPRASAGRLLLAGYTSGKSQLCHLSPATLRQGTSERGRGGGTRHWGLKYTPVDDLPPVDLREPRRMGRSFS